MLPETDAGVGAGCKGGAAAAARGECGGKRGSKSGVGGDGGGGGGGARRGRGGVYGRCAVVGSSGILLYHDHGGEIDAHDVVIRFNSAPTRARRRHPPRTQQSSLESSVLFRLSLSYQ